MPNEFINQTLQVNLNDANPAVPITGIGAPGTGFLGSLVEHLGVAGCTFLTATIVAFVASIIFFILHEKLSRHHKIAGLISSVALFVVSICCVIPTATQTTEALKASNDAVVIDLDIPEGTDSATAVKTTQITLGSDYNDGYVVFVHTDQDNSLYDDDSGASFAVTKSAGSVNEMTMNSWGIKDEQGRYGSLSTMSDHPTKILDDADRTAAGSIIPITYAVKADNTMPTGHYTSKKAAIHFDVQPDIYRIHYVGYSEEDYTQEKRHNATFQLAEKPSKPGFTFVGYNTKPDGTGKQYRPGETLTLDYVNVTLYTIWQANKYDVSFDHNDGTGTSETKTETVGSKYQLPSTPTRLGYSFQGWFTEQTGGQLITGDTVVAAAGPSTLYAHWQANVVKTTFNANGGTFDSGTKQDISETYDSKYKLPTKNPTRIGYTFQGWFTAVDGGQQVTSETTMRATSDHTLYAHWKENTYHLIYDMNGGSGGPGTATQTTNPHFTIDSAKPSKAFHTFIGWADKQDAQVAKYQAGNSIQLVEPSDGTAVSSKTLYAVWVVTFDDAYAAAGKTKDGTTGLYKMQDMTKAICQAVTLPVTGSPQQAQMGQVVDIRDHKTYGVGKMADGHCWMNQNLDLELSNQTELSRENTDLNGDVTKWRPKHSTIAPGALSQSTWPGDAKEAYSYNVGEKYYFTSGSSDNDTIYDSLAACTAVHPESECKHYHAGNLYNWSAAKATDDSTSQSSIATSSFSSICPRGWTLPSVQDSNNSDFRKMLLGQGVISPSSDEYATGGFANIRQKPLYWTRVGYIDFSANLSGQGSGGLYWSNNASSEATGRAYEMSFYSNRITPNNPTLRAYGQSVRCVEQSNIYALKYNANGTDVSNLPATQVQKDNSTFNISTVKPTRPGYIFRGWATSQNATIEDYDRSNQGPIVVPESTITTTSEKTLYAIWGPAIPSGPTYMQDVISTTKGLMNEDSTYTVIDKRDDKAYSVAKLKDGNIWMIENLRLGSGIKEYTLTSANSNVTENFTLPAMPTTQSWSSNSPMLYPSNDQDTTSSSRHSYYGYYYNWNAATAGTGTRDSSAQPTADICPKGWSLPYNYTIASPDRSYSNLLYSYGVIADIRDVSGYADGGYAKMVSAPLNFALSGSHKFSGTGISNRGVNGQYWSRSGNSSTNAYYLLFNSTDMRPQFSIDKSYGNVVRCLAL